MIPFSDSSDLLIFFVPSLRLIIRAAVFIIIASGNFATPNTLLKAADENISEFIENYEEGRAAKKAEKEARKKPEGIEKFME